MKYIPIPQGRGQASIDIKNIHNMSLYYHKFCDEWNNIFDEFTKEDWVNKLLTLKEIGNQQNLDDYNKRVRLLVQEDKDCIFRFRTVEPLITGLGIKHPLENGFLWHHILGVPYIPGSTIKGMLRSLAEAWLENDTEEIKKIFGSSKKEEIQNQIGSHIFFDALPLRPVQIKADIMTNHYTEYYGKQGQVPPSDNQDPLPIAFLVVPKNTDFQFIIKPRCKDNQTQIIDWLKIALRTIGIGAKTAVGYGRMRSVKQHTDEEKWIKNQIPIVMKEHHIKFEKDVLASSGLAKRWREFFQSDLHQTDNLKKERVKEEIFNQCKRLNGKLPSKKAMLVYNENK